MNLRRSSEIGGKDDGGSSVKFGESSENVGNCVGDVGENSKNVGNRVGDVGEWKEDLLQRLMQENNLTAAF